MRNESFQWTMRWLAMFALLLLAVMPTIARISTSYASSSHELAAPCGMPGMKLLVAADAGMPGHPALPGNPEHYDCPYCLLLHALAGFAVILLLLPFLRLPDFLRTPRCTAGIHGFYPRGLGSQGPPLIA